MRTIEDVLIALMAYQVGRLWWRLNRRRVKRWWQWVKDHLWWLLSPSGAVFT
jgi:hypothetical protein